MFVALVGLQFGIAGWAYKLSGGNPNVMQAFKGEIPPGLAIAMEIVMTIGMIVATWIMARVEGRSFFSYGFGGPSRLRRLGLGALAGILAMLAIAGLLILNHNLVIEGRALHGSVIIGYAALWGFNFFLVGIAEEGMLRGYLQYTLTRGINFLWAAIILSIAFALLHSRNPGESPFGIFGVIIIALVFCYSLWLTGSLWWAVGAHAAWDWTQSYVLGVADSGLRVQGHLYASHPVGAALWSGGTTGPEGSVYTLPILALLAAGLYLAWGRRPAGVRSR